MPLIFWPPSPWMITSNSVCSSAATAPAPPAAGPATATAAAAETPHFSSSSLARSAASRTVSSESWSTILLRSAIVSLHAGESPQFVQVDNVELSLVDRSGGVLVAVGGEHARKLRCRGVRDRKSTR